MEARLEPTLVSARRATFWTWLFLIGALGFARAQDSGALDPILVRDILPGPDGSLPDDFLAVGGRLYFTAFESIDPVNNELWVTRGDTGSTQLVFDFPGSSNPDELTAIDDTVYFAASDAVRGRELWRTNGAGATLVRDINPGSFASSPRGLKAVGSQLFFTANDGVNGRELWRLDTTSGATNLVADITPGDGSTVFFSNPTAGPNFAAVGDQLFFVADDGVHGRELWRSDGTAAGTRLVRDIQPGAGSGLRFSLEPVVAAPVLDMIALDDDRLLFAADDGSSGGELWSSDGTEAGTFRVRDILPGDFGSEPLDFAALPLAGLVIFTARDGVSGNEIWRSDGTLAGTQLLRDVNPGLASSLPSWLTTIGNEVFFAAREPVAGDELWATDGTTAGTRRVADILPGAGGGAPGKPVRGPDGLAYFTADDGVTGPELWRSDGTAEGTELAADINPGPDGSFPFNRLASTTELVYAQADDGTSGGELWAVPGTNTLLVNSVGDAVDADTSNRRCDTGAMMGEAVECTLRAAIQESNARAERQVIRFAIAPDQARDGVFVIDVANSLPVVTDPVTIDATTQAGYAVGQPVVEIAGPGRDSPIWGFQVIGTDDTIIRGFSIYGVGRNGILIRGGRGHTIEANIVGTNARGAQEPGIGEDGIFVRDSSGNRIGGVGAVPRNVVSRNGLARTAGCGIRVQGGAENRVQGNYVGLDPAGVEARPNGLSGICLFDAPFNTVGGLVPGEANVSSGNQLHGIEISGEPSTGNRILGNTIGLDAAGGAAVPNRRNGISIGSAASGNIIGDGTEEGRNVVSGNLMAGITIDAGIGFNQVDGNWIGLNGAGNAAVPNGAGIEIRDSPRNRIGVIEGNAISGNDGHGVHIIGDPAVENQIQDNLIGTGPDGLAAVPNVFDGVRIEGARGTGVVGNVIANNGGFGVAILGKQDGQPAIDAQG
ncbi:MAG: ELWxxDGT repeat protein, partial [Pseudomonadota bacterium]